MYLRVTIPSFRQIDGRDKEGNFAMVSDTSSIGAGLDGQFADHVRSPGGGYGKGHFVYQIEVVSNNFGDEEGFHDDMKSQAGSVQLGQGRFFRLEKRYSAFLALHNEVTTRRANVLVRGV